MSDSTSPDVTSLQSPVEEASSTEVFAVHGAEPEVLAYAMAKYSRSALSMKESLREINGQKAEKFLNTFYFQYGHRSIADLAHIALAIEKLSILAAIAVVDEQRWDGQERSTRYQDFKKGGWYVPAFGGNSAASASYDRAIRTLFSEYTFFSEAMFRELARTTPCPADMKPEVYDRTLRARAFDISRYLLPLATNTSLGQIVNARTLETQISRLLSSGYGEIRMLGERLKLAATEPAYNINEESWRDLIQAAQNSDPHLAAFAGQQYKNVRVAPTLVKYAEPSPYALESRRALTQAAASLMGSAPVNPAPVVDLLEDEPLDVELATTLLYEYCHYPYRQIRDHVQDLPEARRKEIIDLGTASRGRHDELLRAFCSGQRFRFDILMDIGGFRDMHRHRRCVQVGQEFTALHGFDIPGEIRDAGLEPRYEAAMQQAAQSAAALAGELNRSGGSEGEATSHYILPLGYRKRTLFKMDFAEVVYIAELRTTPAGHMSYRRAAYAMFEETVRRYPSLAGCFARVTDVREPVDLLKR
ncbi:MAG TPA: FAD-dependent thymidylate synthase [Terriglobales bacterium]|nr:FAD-dependent thymidylate synthase [Terriglobales bacterium]